jgi:hypothetical protein
MASTWPEPTATWITPTGLFFFMVKTIELMLGLPTLSLFDLIATDMRASFTTTPDVRP